MKRIKEVRVASWLNEEEPSTQVAVDEFIVLSIPALLGHYFTLRARPS